MTAAELNLRPGDFFVVRTNGWIAQAIRFATSSTVNHAGIYVGNGKIVEAQPGGARYASVDNYKTALWSAHNLPDDLEPTDTQRAAIVAQANKLIGTPYGFWDIAAIAFTQRVTGKLINPAKPYKDQPLWVRQIIDRLRDTHELICSQLVDLCYQLAGVHLFTDGRFEGFVSPEDLRALLIEGITEGPQK